MDALYITFREVSNMWLGFSIIQASLSVKRSYVSMFSIRVLNGAINEVSMDMH